jgi:hypothetical protein
MSIVGPDDPFVLFPSATVTVDTPTNEIFSRFPLKAAYFVWDLTAISGGSTDARLQVQFFNPLTGLWTTFHLTATVTTPAPRTYVIGDNPYTSGQLTGILNVPLPRRWRFLIDLVSATSATMSIVVAPVPHAVER